MRAYLIERSTMEWCFIRCALDDYLRSGALVSPRYERAVRELVDAIRAMTRYDDQHAFPDRPPVDLPERVQRVESAREYVDRKGAEYAAAIRPFASKARSRDPLDPLGIAAATAASKPKRRWWRRRRG